MEIGFDGAAFLRGHYPTGSRGQRFTIKPLSQPEAPPAANPKLFRACKPG